MTEADLGCIDIAIRWSKVLSSVDTLCETMEDGAWKDTWLMYLRYDLEPEARRDIPKLMEYLGDAVHAASGDHFIRRICDTVDIEPGDFGL